MEKQFFSLLTRLVGINSVNSTLSNGPGEGELAEFVLDHLRHLNIGAEIQTITPGRANVVAAVPGKDRKDALLLNSHLDTVGVEGMEQPFTLRQVGDKLYGRGAYDMKGSAAIMLMLAEYFVKHPPAVDILLTFVADEEDLSVGMEYVVDNWLKEISPRPSGAIFLEPTEEEIGVSHKGFNWYELEIIGKAAHGSRPEQGIDAILPLGSVMNEMSRIQAELLQREPDPLLGYASLHTSIIEGGTELSVIPSRSKLKWERRTLPGELQHDLDLELGRMIDAAENHPGNHEVKARQLFVRLPHKVPHDAQVLKRLQKASPQSRYVGLSYWADSALVAQAGIPSVLYGPIDHGAHAVDEWVSLKSLVRVYEVLKKLIETW